MTAIVIPFPKRKEPDLYELEFEAFCELWRLVRGDHPTEQDKEDFKRVRRMIDSILPPRNPRGAA